MSEPLIVGFASLAAHIQIGDTVTTEAHCFVARQVSRVEPTDKTPDEIAKAGGWVNIAGDTGDGHYRRNYGSEQEYYAAPDEMIDVVREVARFVPLTKDRSHDHSTDGIIGYVVRETIANGEVIRAEDGRVGRDVAVIECGTRYADTFPIRDRYRNQRGGYAVVDSLYACGCRDGQR